jgi:predicted Zn-dependent protease
MRVLRSTLIGIAGGLLLTVGTVKGYDITTALYTTVGGQITDAEAQEIYGKVVRASGQSNTMPQMAIDESTQVNAYTTSSGIVVFRGLLNRVNKDELALVLAHEAAHFLLGHVFLTYTPTKDQIRVEEMQADKYGAFLALRAGYDVCEGRKFFKDFSRLYGDNQDQDHPDFAFRYDQLDINCGG